LIGCNGGGSENSSNVGGIDKPETEATLDEIVIECKKDTTNLGTREINLLVGDSLLCFANAKYSDGADINITDDVTWDITGKSVSQDTANKFIANESGVSHLSTIYEKVKSNTVSFIVSNKDDEESGPIKPNEILLKVKDFADKEIFKDIGNIRVSVLNETTQTKVTEDLPLYGSKKIKNLDPDAKYTITTSGLGDLERALFYTGNTITNYKLSGESLIIDLTKKTTGLRSVKFNINGIAEKDQQIKIRYKDTTADTSSIANYSYNVGKLSSTIYYKLPADDEVNISTSNLPSGYELNVDPVKISPSINLVQFNFNKR
jgi:hypothetical protein